MISKEVVINNQVGLHARPATFFIQKANEFKSSIWVEKEERRVNAKSLLGVLSLGIVKGTAITIIADGVDEEAAIATLSELIELALIAAGLGPLWSARGLAAELGSSRAARASLCSAYGVFAEAKPRQKRIECVFAVRGEKTEGRKPL